jgi:pyruvate formate lyase activating enzyme
MTIGRVNEILRSSFVDGPGHRAVIFLQGCSFNCLYCHNPYTINECIHCGICVDACPADALENVDGKVIWNRERCTECDTCIKICPYFSSPKVRDMTPEDVWQEIEPAAAFISGVSVSGGEPLLQIPFLIELFNLIHARSDLTTLIETNGSVDNAEMCSMLPYVDLVQVDLKCGDETLHEKLTGQPIDAVIQNIRSAYAAGKLFSVQQVIVDEFTASKELIAKTAKILASIDPSIRLRLVKFRAHGTTGAAAEWQSPTDAVMNALQTAAFSNGLENVVISL